MLFAVAELLVSLLPLCDSVGVLDAMFLTLRYSTSRTVWYSLAVALSLKSLVLALASEIVLGTALYHQ